MNNIKLCKYTVVKRLLSLALGLILLCFSALFTACSSENYSIYFGVNEMPKNIDPQKAESHAELLAVRNCFRGLYKQDTDGNPVPDLAETTKISADGLTYTFKLKNAEWKNQTPVTADDFLFAISRAADPVTAAPYNDLLSNIVGVPEFVSGNSNAALGVYADGDTLTIKLIEPDKTFLSKLCLSVFMPCNQEFFEGCKGKYGLSRKNILTNGNYYPSQWTENKHLKLTLVNEADSSIPQNVFISVSTTGKNNIQRIKAKEVGMTADSVNDFYGIDENEYTVETLYQKNYALVFNKSSSVGSNRLLTDAFAKAVHREYFEIKMSQRFTVASSVLPKDCTVLEGYPANVTVPDYAFELNIVSAREDFLNALSEFKGGKLPNISVLTVENDEIKSALNNIVSGWQSNLGAYVNITTVSTEHALLEKVRSGDYTLALVPLSGTATEILSLFSEPTSGLYLNNDAYNSAVNILTKTDDFTAANQAIAQCLDVLSKESAVIPVLSVPTAYIYDSEYNNVVFSRLDSTVDFSIIYKNQ